MKLTRGMAKVWLLVMLVVQVAGIEAQGAMAGYMKIGDIKGESTDETYKDALDVLSWSWGMSNSGSFYTGGGGAGKANFQDLSITVLFDRSTPKLALACASGTHFPTAELILRRGSNAPYEFLKIVLTDVLVSSVSTGGSMGEDRPVVSLSLNYAKVEVTYFTDPASGTGEQSSMNWSIVENTGG